MTNFNNNEHPQRPNMSGNIQLIFILLGGGLSLAFGCLMLEFKDMVLNILCKCCIFVYNVFKKLFKYIKGKVILISRYKFRNKLWKIFS